MQRNVKKECKKALETYENVKLILKNVCITIVTNNMSLNAYA